VPEKNLQKPTPRNAVIQRGFCISRLKLNHFNIKLEGGASEKYEEKKWISDFSLGQDLSNHT
jgi:hypothetical protein